MEIQMLCVAEMTLWHTMFFSSFGIMVYTINAYSDVARVCRQFLGRKHINVLDCPAQYPDLSPIEHIWDELSKSVRRCPVQGIA